MFGVYSVRGGIGIIFFDAETFYDLKFREGFRCYGFEVDA